MIKTFKIGSIFLGAILTLVVVELGLRLAGGLFFFTQEQFNKSIQNDQRAINILCVGESMTALGGKNSYPAQLEIILNKQAKNKSFKVINKGIPGITTPALLEDLPKQIKEYQPQFIVAMMGINDQHYGLGQEARVDQRHLLKKSLINDLRVSKLFRLLKKHIALKKKELQLRYAKGELALGQYYKDQGWFYKAEELFLKMMEKDPYHHKIYLELGSLYRLQGFFAESIKMYEEAVKVNPKSAEGYWHLGEIYKESALHTKEQSDEMFLEATKLDPKYVLSQPNQKVITQEINSVTQQSYLKLQQYAKRHNIQLIVVQYPLRELRKMQDIFIEPNEILFVDNEAIFKEVLKKQSYHYYFSDNFAGDFGHCTKEGNRLLANNVAQSILQ